ncbi:phage tail tape measure protein, partial [Methanosarcinales archaeon]
MVKAMQLMSDATKNMVKTEQLAVFGEIFGKNAVAGALNLAGSLSEVEYIMKKLEGETNLKDLADEIRKGLGMQIEILKSGLIELGFKFIEAFEKNGRGALQGLIDAVQTIDITPLIETAKVFVGFMTFLGKSWRVILSLVVAIKAVAVVMGILTIATQVFGVTL